MRQAGGHGAAIVVLVEMPLDLAAIVHGVADIHDQVAAQIGLFLELLDVELVSLGPDFPVEMANVVARRVIPVLHALDGMAEERTAVHARDKAFDNRASA